MNGYRNSLLLFAALVLSACSPADRNAETAVPTEPGRTQPEVPAPAPPAPAPVTNVHAGWYMEHGEMGMLQLCGQSEQLTVESADLLAQAESFGLEPNTPVYVRVAGSTDGSNFTVTRVEQFGSPTPVSDCGLAGVVMPSGG